MPTGPRAAAWSAGSRSARPGLGGSATRGTRRPSTVLDDRCRRRRRCPSRGKPDRGARARRGRERLVGLAPASSAPGGRPGRSGLGLPSVKLSKLSVDGRAAYLIKATGRCRLNRPRPAARPAALSPTGILCALLQPTRPPLPMTRLCHRNAIRRLIGVVWLALLLGQWTALVHSIDHAPSSAAVAGSADTDHAWSHGAGTSACHLVDHLLTGHGPGGQPATVCGFPPAGLRVAASAPSIGPGPLARAYEARGPPWA